MFTRRCIYIVYVLRVGDADDVNIKMHYCVHLDLSCQQGRSVLFKTYLSIESGRTHLNGSKSERGSFA